MARGDEAAGHAAGRGRPERSSCCRDRRRRRSARARRRRSRPTFSPAGSRPTRGSASPKPRRATASARRRCARRCRGSPRAGWSTRDGNRGFRVTPISRADLADIVLIRSVDRARGAAARDGARRRRLGGRHPRRPAPAQARRRAGPARLSRGRRRLRRAAQGVPRRADRRLRLAAPDRRAEPSSTTRPIATGA